MSDSDTGTSPQTLYFFGTGLNATATLAPISRTNVAFGRQTVGTTSNQQFLFLQNIGNTALTFTTPLSGTNPGAFAAANTCSGSIPAGGTCDVTVTFAPTAVGPFFATLTINSGATGAPQTVGLSGTGIPATTVSLLPNPLIFPAISVGQSSAIEYAYLNNTGPNADTISGITIPQIPGSDFDDFQVSLTGPGNTPCSFNGVLNAQAVCVIGVVFTPITTGLRTATLEVIDSATGTPHTITLQGGSGIAPLQITTTSPLSGATVGAAYSTTLAATGGTPPYTWSYVSGTLPPGLSVGSTGIISGTPTTAGPYSFVVKVTDSMSPTQNSAQGTFSITVTAASGGISFSSTTLPAGAVTVPYGADIQVTGGIPPYTFAATGLPTGFTLDTTGVGNAAPGHVFNNAPQNAGTFTFNVTVTDSTTPTPLTGNATVSLTIAAMPANTQPGLLKGQYAMILRGFNEVTGAEEALVGSLTFDGTGNITSGELDVNSTGTAGIESGVSATGSYAIGSDNRGEMSITPEGQAPGIFAISVGKILNGVAASAYITSFIDDTGAGDLYAGTLQLQDPTAFNNDAFAGTYIYASTGQGPQGTRVSELGLTTLNNANTVTSGSADSNNDGHAGIISTITGTYTTPDSNGRSSLALTVNTTPSLTAVYQVNANEAVYMTLDARDSNVLLVGTAVKQPSPGSFSNASLAGPDVFSLVGSSGPSATSTNIGVLTVTPGASPTVNITLDTNDQGTVTIGRVQTGALSIAANGRGTMSPGGTNLIFYLTQPDTGFVMATDSPVEFGPIQRQTGAPFSATPFANTNLFFGQQEAVGGASSEFSGIANIGASNSFSPVDDESHNGGDLFFDQALGSFTYAVNSSGHITLTSSTQGDSSGYMVSPYETVFMDTNGPASDPAPSAHPHVIVAQSIPAQVASGVTVAPPSLTFTSQTVLTTSAPRSVTVSNNGTAAVTFSGFTVTGTNAADFSVPLPNMPGMCSPTGTLAADSSCTINVLFTPQAAGTRTATLNVSDSATGSPQTVALSGTGTAPLGTILIAPTSLTFESQLVGTTSATQTVTVANVGDVNVTFTSIATTGDFSGATTAQCPTLSTDSPPCTFQIAFKPTAAGTRTGAITFTDNATGSPQTVTLTGTGMNGPATVTVSPTSLTFASQTIGSTSPAQNVTVTNTGTGPVNFTSFSITGENSSSFALAGGANACNPTGTLAANASCTIGVTFTPTATGELGATLSITDNATTSPQLVSLNGTGNNSPVIITIPPGGSTTGTATPGGTAFFGLQITGAPGVTGTVQLGCTPSSPTITCNVIPSSIVLTGKPIEVAFGIQTYCQGATNTGFAPSMPRTWPTGGIALLLLSLALGGTAWAMQRNRRVALTFAVLMLVALGSAACGGLAKGPNGATPPGTYSLTLTTTFNGQTQTMPNFLTLVVK
ncbi:MAG: choice-of-anchor D domain-containing protein [Candidatus Acidiferrales bacterium]